MKLIASKFNSNPNFNSNCNSNSNVQRQFYQQQLTIGPITELTIGASIQIRIKMVQKTNEEKSISFKMVIQNGDSGIKIISLSTSKLTHQQMKEISNALFEYHRNTEQIAKCDITNLSTTEFSLSFMSSTYLWITNDQYRPIYKVTFRINVENETVEDVNVLSKIQNLSIIDHYKYLIVYEYKSRVFGIEQEKSMTFAYQQSWGLPSYVTIHYYLFFMLIMLVFAISRCMHFFCLFSKNGMFYGL